MPAPENSHNPFASQYIRPGAIPFIFPPKHSPDSLLDSLQAARWRGEILGPHGTGKSTLLHALRQPLLDANRELAWYELHPNQRSLGKCAADKSTVNGPWTAQTLVIVDGAEQLAWWQRQWLLFRCGMVGAGVLWTTHRPLGLPCLWETKVDVRLAENIVTHLFADQEPTVSHAEISQALTQTNFNAREMLFRLFDVVQRRA